MWRLLRFWHYRSDPRYSDCPDRCTCAEAFTTCPVTDWWDEELGSVFPLRIITDAANALKLAKRYGARETEAGYREPQYRREWPPRVLAIVRIGEARLAEWAVALRREAQQQAADNART